jgi:hypothetical protein
MNKQALALPELKVAAAIERELDEAIERRVLDPARRIGHELEAIGLTALPEGTLVQPTAHGTWLLAADYLNDPGLAQDRAIAIPERELQTLRRLRAAGVSVDLIWIAHELPGDWQPDKPMPLIVPDAPRYRQLDQQLERLVVGAARTTLTAAKGVAVATAAVGALGVGLVAGLASASEGLDPVILGGVRHPTEQVVAWAVLAQWHWQ